MTKPSQFYTGLVAVMYSRLRSADPDPEPYARFIEAVGEPALELGCGDGDPLLEIRRRGFDVEGLDSSRDMLERCRARATAAGLDVVLHESAMETMQLPRMYRSIYLAGPTFNLLPDDHDALRALERAHSHLVPGGALLIPLFIPPEAPNEELGHPKVIEEDGATLQVTPVRVERDAERRLQSTWLRYERVRGDQSDVLEREWIIHWHTQQSFRVLAEQAGLRVASVRNATGGLAAADADQFAFVLSRP